MTAPTTEAGRALAGLIAVGTVPADGAVIARIEAEARHQERERIAAAVRATTAFGAFEGCGGHGCARDRLEDYDRVFAAIKEES